MADYTYEDVMIALKKADAAGNTEDARKLASIANNLRKKPRGGPQVMSRVNRGIASSVGGLADLINPFDKPHALNPFPDGTGSAVTGIENAMRHVGVDVADGEPEGLVENAAEGFGKAAGALIPVAKAAQGLKGAGGIVGTLADDIWRALTSVGGVAAEVTAGATADVSRSLAKDAGAGQVGQDIAAILGGGVALPIVAAPHKAVGALANTRFAQKYVPSVMAGKNMIGAVKGAIAPYTESGGREVARKRMQELAGGPERAEQLASRISSQDEFGLTPAQQADDPNLMAVERLAADQDPNLRARLEDRAARTQDAGEQAVAGMGGNEADATAFFAKRRKTYADELKARASDAVRSANDEIAKIGPKMSEADNSLIVRKRIDIALERAVDEEAALWDKVPRGATVGVENTREAVKAMVESMPYAQRGDIPAKAGEVLTQSDVYGDVATVNDMHGLYSELRRVSRSAMAGSDQNKNLARVANEIADAILKDLGAVDATTEIGKTINNARAYSAALHETFDRGAVGRLLKRTIDGDASIDPELSLRRTVGRAGPEGAVSSRQISNATKGAADPAIADYIKGRFNKAAHKATGEFDYRSAKKFWADNKPLLERFPELASDIDAAVLARDNADQFSERITRRIAALQKGAGQKVAEGQAVKAIMNDKDPFRAAVRITSEARKDPSGKALDGIKAAFADELIQGAKSVKGGKSEFSGDKLLATLSDKKMKAALRQVFSEPEMRRLQYIARAMNKATRQESANIGTSLSGAKPNKIIEYVARVFAARHGAALGGSSGGSLQTAQMASSRVKEILGRLVSDKAGDIMARAVEDPDLFKALLTDVGRAEIDQLVIPRLAPYLIGTAAEMEGAQ